MKFTKSILLAAVLVFIGSMFGGSGIVYSADKVAREKQTDRPAVVFLVAGQSNAGGCGVFSPEIHEKHNRHETRPLVPGSTAKEIGLSTDVADYTHSYMWVPGEGFQRTNPDTNVRPSKMNSQMHGMELPVIAEMEKRFGGNDIYVVKYGPGATNLHHDWNPDRTNGRYAIWLGYYRNAMAQLSKEYPEVRVAGLYWDQGESDGADNKAGEYEKNLINFIAAVRRDTGVPQLRFFIRKHIFNWANIDTVIEAQEKVVENDSRCYMLDIDLGDRKANYEAWAYSPNNGHVSSKGFVELTKRLFDGPLRNAKVESFDLYQASGKVTSAKILTDTNNALKGRPLPMKRFKDTPETACLYHFDRSFTWVDNLEQRSHLLTPDDDSANPGRVRNALMNYWGPESGSSSITTGNQGLSGKEGDEALQVQSKPDRSSGAYSVMKWVFDGTPFQDFPELTDPWDDFDDYAWVEFYVKPFEKTTAHGNPDAQVVSKVVGVWSLELRIDSKTGNRGLQLLMSSDGGKVMQPNEGQLALWIPDFFEKQSLNHWHHIIIEYDKRNVMFRVDDVTREATMPDDLWQRKGTPWTFGFDKKGIGVNALFDEARMIMRPER